MHLLHNYPQYFETAPRKITREKMTKTGIASNKTHCSCDSKKLGFVKKIAYIGSLHKKTKSVIRSQRERPRKKQRRKQKCLYKILKCNFPHP